MKQQQELEVWMRGPVKDVPALLQPVAHALLQVEEDVIRYLSNLDNEHLLIQPEGAASIAFHVKHIVGVIDRMFTYAQEKPLAPAQFDYLAGESKENNAEKEALLQLLHNGIQKAIDQLKQTDPNLLTHERFLGRKRIPTSLIGLLFHAAEHTQRHVGQLLVTARWVKKIHSIE
jgi:uncharacterized damage-inducible protein DinB